MTLHFIYILKYENIFENVGFNFGGKYRFKYDQSSQLIDVSENPLYDDTFFQLGKRHHGANYAKVENVTAIIGENGVGKSSLLQFIKQNFVEGQGGISYPVIVALTTDEGEKKIYRDANIPLKKSENDLAGFRIITIGETIKKIKSDALGLIHLSEKPAIEELNATDFIYFSNIYDGTLEYSFHGLLNISTNYLIKETLKEKIERDENWTTTASKLSSELETHKFEDIFRQLNFISKSPFRDEISFRLPTKMVVSLARNLLTLEEKEMGMQSQSMLDTYGYLEFTRRFRLFCIAKMRSKVALAEKTLISILGNAVLNYFHEISKYTRYHRITGLEAFKPNETDDFKSILASLLELLITELNNFKRVTDKSGPKYGPYDKELSELNSFRAMLKYLGENLNENNCSGDSFRLESEQNQSIVDFFSIYQSTFTFDPYLNFTWSELSSGEKALLNIYSRFFSVSDQVLSTRAANLIPKKNVIILIDEGEAYFHPNWQTKLIANLLTFLPANFQSTNTRALQLILTSNSPFIASDLPSTNVIFLKRDELSNIVVLDSLEERRQTFAANIFALLSDAFFMRDGAIGEFAKQKINRVIDLLQEKPEVVEDNRQFIQNTIKMIGEPVIKSKLTQLLTERLSLDLLGLNDRVTSLENDLKSLKRD